MQHLFSKISMWAALAASAVALSACGGGSGSGSSVNGPHIQVFPSDNFNCVAGQECGYIVRGTGFPFMMWTNSPTIKPKEITGPGWVPLDVVGNPVDGTKVIVVFGSKDCDKFACGAARLEEREITFGSGSTSSGSSGSQGGQIGPGTQMPNLIVKGSPCTSGAANCIALNGSGTLEFEFDTSKSWPSQLLKVGYSRGDWVFGADYAKGTTDPQELVECANAGGSCVVPISTAPTLSPDGNQARVFITYKDPKTGDMVTQSFNFTVEDQPSFVMETVGSWIVQSSDTNRKNCDQFFDNGAVALTTNGSSAILPVGQVEYTISAEATPAPTNSAYKFAIAVYSDIYKTSQLSTTLTSNADGTLQTAPIYLFPMNTCNGVPELYANCAPRDGKIDIKVHYYNPSTKAQGDWVESIYCAK